MCGRFVQCSDPHALAEFFELSETKIRVFDFRPRYNLAPTQPVLAIRLDESGERELVSLTWGLIPFWAKEKKTGYSTINAKAETVAEKPTFRKPFRKRRCLIPTEAFYEWKKDGSAKLPYCIGLKSGEPFAFAGLWDRWQDEEEVIDSCTIIVTDANSLLKTIHDRMPVILPRESYDEWLNPETPPETAKGLLLSYDSEEMRCYPVSRRVNTPKNDDASLIEPVEEPG